VTSGPVTVKARKRQMEERMRVRYKNIITTILLNIGFERYAFWSSIAMVRWREL
jgi:hypothetical protein